MLKKNFIDSFYMNIFLVLSFLSLMSKKYFWVKPGIIGSILMIIAFFVYYRYLNDFFHGINVIYFVYFLLIIFSLLFYIIYSENNITLYFKGLNFNLSPLIMYFIGYVFIKKRINIINKIMIVNLIIIWIGFYFHLFKPDFYIENIVLQKYEYLKDVIRLRSFYSSQIISTISTISIPLLFMNIKKIRPSLFVLYLMSFIIAALLSTQRAAFIMLFFGIIISLLIHIKQNKKISLRLFLFIFAISIIIIFSFSYVKQTTEFEKVDNQINKLDSAVSERVDQWERSFAVFLEHPFGVGIGGAGHNAMEYTEDFVSDGNYFRILAELGVFGLLLFLTINYLVLFKSVDINGYLTVTILIFLFHAIGANILDLFYTSHIYWFLMGYIANMKRKDIYYS